MDEAERKVESLLAMLLSERSKSKITRQKADQLAQRVEELERQLEIVTNQKKKAEKAAAKLLSILQDDGIMKYSDDEESDGKEMISGECEEDKIWPIEHPGIEKTEACSMSGDLDEVKDGEVNMLNESPSSSGTVSWTSYDSNFSSSHGNTMRKSHELSVKHKSCNFTLGAGSSPKRRTGKSCRQIRRRETGSGREQEDTNYSKTDIIVEGFVNVKGTEIGPPPPENTPEQTSGKENCAKVFPESTKNIPPVQEKCWIGTWEQQASLCEQHQSEENVQLRVEEAATRSCFSSAVYSDCVNQADAIVRPNTPAISVDTENPVAGVGTKPEENMRNMLNYIRNTQPEAGENTVQRKGGLSSKGPDEKASTCVTVSSQVNAPGFSPSDVDLGAAKSSLSSAKAASSELACGHFPTGRALCAEESAGKQPMFYVESPSPSTPDSRSQIFLHESSNSINTLAFASRCCIGGNSAGELDGVLRNLQLARFAIRSRLDMPPSKDGAIVATTDRMKTAEDSKQFPFISCSGLFRLPPSSHQYATRPSAETPYSNLLTGPTSGDQYNHSYPDSRCFCTGNMYARSSTAASPARLLSSDAYSGFTRFPPPSDEQNRNFR